MGFNFKTYEYDTSEENQAAFNRILKEKADVVVRLIKQKGGIKVEECAQLAVLDYNKIMSFVPTLKNVWDYLVEKKIAEYIYVQFVETGFIAIYLCEYGKGLDFYKNNLCKRTYKNKERGFPKLYNEEKEVVLLNEGNYLV